MRTNLKQRDRGIAALELVIAATFLLAMVVAIAQFGLFFNRRVEVESAARDAARTLALRQTPTYPAGMAASAITTCAAGDVTNNASVTLTATYTFTIPFIPLGSRPITATGRMRCGG